MLPDDPTEAPLIIPTNRLNLDDLWATSWHLMKANYALLIVASLIMLTAAVVPIVLNIWIPYVNHFLSALLYAPILAGALMLGVRVARGPRPVLGDILVGTSRYWPLVAIGLILESINFVTLELPMLLVQKASSSPASPQSAFLSCGLFVVTLPLMIFFAIRFWLAPVICLDEHAGNPGVFRSLKIAWRISGPNFWPMFLVSLLTGLIIIGSALFLGVGVILLGFPFYLCAFGVIYTRLMGPLPAGICPECGYNTTASPSPLCPECGTPTGLPLPPPIYGPGSAPA